MVAQQMMQNTIEYRYSQTAQRRAAQWLALSALVSMSLVVVLFTRWADLNTLARTLGLLLAISLFFTARAQLTRLAYRCQLLPDHLQIVAPLSNRSIAWADVVEVRRMLLPGIGAQSRWACTLLVRGRRGNPLPVFIFDDQLADAESALRGIVQRTSHAQHVNV